MLGGGDRSGGRRNWLAAGPFALSHVVDSPRGDLSKEGGFLTRADEALRLVSSPLGCLPLGFPLRAEAGAETPERVPLCGCE